MTLVLVEVPDKAAVEILRLQKNVRVVGIIEQSGDAYEGVRKPPLAQPSPKPSVASLIGSISPESAKRMLQQNAELRDEWERES
ncbi:hypothetical protein [Hymenobacter coalescens]